MIVCTNCFSDEEIKEFIKTNSVEQSDCQYCGSANQSIIPLNDLLELFQEFMRLFEPDESGKALVNLVQKDWNVFLSNEIAVEVLQDLLPLLAHVVDQPTVRVSYIGEIRDSVDHWNVLKQDLKTEKRFLTNMSDLIEYRWDGSFNEKIPMPKRQIYYRARIHHNDSEMTFAIDEMGCPPAVLSKSGRANALGIPVLYLSLELETTLYEARGTLLDELSIGHFMASEDKEIILVDFINRPSIFYNIGDMLQTARESLLKSRIAVDLSKPMRRYDSELDYIPTQFICEFIRAVTKADGILFESSVFEKGQNVVLFNESNVECFDVVRHRVNHVSIQSQVVD